MPPGLRAKEQEGGGENDRFGRRGGVCDCPRRRRAPKKGGERAKAATFRNAARPATRAVMAWENRTIRLPFSKSSGGALAAQSVFRV